MATVAVAMESELAVTASNSGEMHARLEGHDLECAHSPPSNPDYVYVGTFSSGLHRSRDGATTFERIGTHTIASDAVTAVTTTPGAPDEVWAGTEPSALYHSRDAGTTWRRIGGLTDAPSATAWSFPPRPHTHHVRWIEVDPHDTDRVYIGIEAGALLVTPDRGDTWIDRPPGSRRDNHSMAAHPDAPARVYAAAGDGYAESRDGGNTWQHPTSGLDHTYCWSVAPAPANPDTILVSSATGPRSAHTAETADAHLYRRTDSGPWRPLTDGPPAGRGVVRAVLTPHHESGRVFLANNHGVYHTPDAGDTWTALQTDWSESYTTQSPRGLAVLDG